MIAYIILGILGIGAIIGILLWIFGKRDFLYDYGKCKFTGCIMTTFCITLIIITSIIIPYRIKDYEQEIYTFEKQKEYIEQVVPTLPETDNYAITHKRIELNEWLYDIQFKNKNYKFWNLIPEEVLDLTPIK